MKKVLAAAAIAVSVSSAAFAADSSVDVPAVAAEVTKAATSASDAADKATSLIDTAKGAVSSASEMVNINTADADTLAKIPGLDEKIAKAITTYRDLKGKFSSIEDLKNVEGLSSTLIDKIAPLIKF